MYALSTTLNTKSMVKPNTLVYFVAQLNTSANFILKCTIQFILIKALRVLKSLERRKIPVQKWNSICILATSYQYYFLQTVLGYIAFEKQIQQHFSKCESYFRERERERERETRGERRCKERVWCAPFFN